MIVKKFNMKKDFHLPGEEMLSNATIPSTISSTYLLEHIRMLIVMMIISLIMLTSADIGAKGEEGHCTLQSGGQGWKSLLLTPSRALYAIIYHDQYNHHHDHYDHDYHHPSSAE